MDHDGVIVDGSLDLIEGEILRKDDRARERSIITLLHEHPLRIEVDRRMLAFSGDRENIAREGNIDEGRIDARDRGNDNEFFREIEDIDRDLTDIHFMIAFLTDLDIDGMIRVIRMSCVRMALSMSIIMACNSCMC